MDNPNSGVTIRRHNSLPGRLRQTTNNATKSAINPITTSLSASTTVLKSQQQRQQQQRHTNQQRRQQQQRLSHSKSNPYVGWFRHAPPTSQSKTPTAAAAAVTSSTNHFNGNKHHPTLLLHTNNNTHVAATDPLFAWRRSLEKKTSLMKNSPYVGWFDDHAPNTSRVLSESFLLLLKLLCCEKGASSTTTASGSYNKDTNNVKASYYDFAADVMLMSDWLNGYLKGGGRSAGDDSADVDDVLVGSLARLACWLFLPQQQQSRRIYRHEASSAHNGKRQDFVDVTTSSATDDEDPVNDEDAGRRLKEDDLGLFDEAPPPSSSSCCSSSVSSQTEAYHAHHHQHQQQQMSSTAKELLEEQEYVEEEATGQDRLDFVITQMDIIRMTRNASRHLDVESILKLPTITYGEAGEEDVVVDDTGHDGKEDEHTRRTRSKCATPNNAQTSTAEGWSWCMVQEEGSLHMSGETQDSSNSNSRKRRQQRQEQQAQQQQEDRAGQQQNVCVICMEQFAQGDRLRVLPCHHSFHCRCIDRWLSGSHSWQDCFTSGCPTCKKRADTAATTACPVEGGAALAEIVGQDSSSTDLDGSVPSWAFAQIGQSMARRDSSDGLE